MKSLWKKRGKTPDKKEIENVCKKTSVGPLVAEILLSRNVKPEDFDTFLDPKLSDLYDPYLLPDMKKAVIRIIRAIRNNERITVYGDYDVDGTLASTILADYLKSIGAHVEQVVPDRIKDGYGLNPERAKDLIHSSDLVITVDCGITSVEEAELFKNKATDLIVTDHHEPGKVLPEAVAVIDAKRVDSNYPFRELCGAGIAFKIVQALNQSLKAPKNLEEYLQLCAVATIADIVPLIDENRTLTKLGLSSINKNGFFNAGMQRLYLKTELDSLNSGRVGFILAPMINAAGRVDSAQKVLTLLTTKDPLKRDALAEELKGLNRERIRIEESVLDEIDIDFDRLDDVIVVAGDGWHPGVIGIVAGKIQEMTHHPAIVIGFDGDKGHGSCRSVPGFDMFKALQHCEAYLDTYGGHEQAAGLSIDRKNLEPFRKALLEYAAQVNIEKYLKKVILYDKMMAPNSINLKAVKELENLGPFGNQNPAPVFRFHAPDIKEARLIGKKRNHLKFKSDGVECVMFGNDQLPNAPIDFLARAEINEFNGRKNLQLNLKDIKDSENFAQLDALFEADENDFLEDYKDDLKRVDRDLFVRVYKLAKKFEDFGFYVSSYLNTFDDSLFLLVLALRVLKEAGLIDYTYHSGLLEFTIHSTNSKKDLKKTSTYQRVQNEF